LQDLDNGKATNEITRLNQQIEDEKRAADEKAVSRNGARQIRIIFDEFYANSFVKVLQ
jgi:phosphotransferase system IIB component